MSCSNVTTHVETNMLTQLLAHTYTPGAPDLQSALAETPQRTLYLFFLIHTQNDYMRVIEEVVS